MLTISNLSIQYKRQLQPAVADFSLHLKKGEIICIVGESGSGKSSVLKAISGGLPKSSRRAADALSFDTHNLLKLSNKDWQKIRGSAIAQVFQNNGLALNPIRTIGDQFVEYICQHTKLTKKLAWEKAQKQLEQLQLSDSQRVLTSYPHQLSGGMCQRIGIALALLFEPKLILADEPTSAVDVISQKQIVELFLDLKKTGKTSMVLVTHNLALAAYLADYIIVMRQGEILDSGPVLDILERPQSAYTRELLAAMPQLGGADGADNLDSHEPQQSLYLATGKKVVGL